MQLTEHLSANYDAVLNLLNDLEFKNISYDIAKQKFRFARAEGRNPTSMVMSLSTLSYYCFSTNDKGNLYTLVMEHENINFPKALEWVADKLGIEKSDFNKKTRLPFGGFYKGLIREIQEPEYSITTYSEEILKSYENIFNLKFFNDGIDFQTQQKYQVGYDYITERITVPIWDLKGNLIGIMGRSIDKECKHEDRWLPIIPCSRSLTLYGYCTNYQSIQNKGLCIVGESEKHTQQLDSMECYIGLSTSGCHISETQAKYIKSLLIPKTILSYDEGLEEEYIREQAKKLKINNVLYQNQVGYIFDKENKYLLKGSKSSPSDKGKKIFTQLIKECTIWI